MWTQVCEITPDSVATATITGARGAVRTRVSSTLQTALSLPLLRFKVLCQSTTSPTRSSRLSTPWRIISANARSARANFSTIHPDVTPDVRSRPFARQRVFRFCPPYVAPLVRAFRRRDGDKRAREFSVQRRDATLVALSSKIEGCGEGFGASRVAFSFFRGDNPYCARRERERERRDVTRRARVIESGKAVATTENNSRGRRVYTHDAPCSSTR